VACENEKRDSNPVPNTQNTKTEHSSREWIADSLFCYSKMIHSHSLDTSYSCHWRETLTLSVVVHDGHELADGEDHCLKQCNLLPHDCLSLNPNLTLNLNLKKTDRCRKMRRRRRRRRPNPSSALSFFF
jgi:hypothetical protein